MGMLHSDVLVLLAGVYVEGFCVRAGPAGSNPMAPHSTNHHEPVALHVMKSTLDVKVPLLGLDKAVQKQVLPPPAQRETRSRKGAMGISGP